MGDYIFEANNIKLCTQSGEKIYNLGNGDCELTVPMSAESDPPVFLSLTTNDTAKFSCVGGADLSLIGDMAYLSNKPRVITHEVPIMIQARWHKKNRVNKKWLKRYGMKRDTVKVEMNIKELTYEPGHMIGRDETGICCTFNSWNFETDMPIYKYRSDQMRRNLKIEFV